MNELNGNKCNCDSEMNKPYYKVCVYVIVDTHSFYAFVNSMACEKLHSVQHEQ